MGTYTGFGIGFLNFFSILSFLFICLNFFFGILVYICIFNSNSLIRHD